MIFIYGVTYIYTIICIHTLTCAIYTNIRMQISKNNHQIKNTLCNYELQYNRFNFIII